MGDSCGFAFSWVFQNRGTIGWCHQETAWGFSAGMMGSLNSRAIDDGCLLVSPSSSGVPLVDTGFDWDRDRMG